MSTLIALLLSKATFLNDIVFNTSNFPIYSDIAQTDVILICIITALQKIVETLPNFLSPYLETILCEISRISTLLNSHKTDNKTEEKSSGLLHKLNVIE